MLEPEKIDKSKMPPGPWHDEPDRIEFEHLGFPCLMRRVAHGGWCGYVAVPPGHPLHGKNMSDEPGDLSVHGGITYAAACSGDICHVSKPGEPDDVWWLGFDCAHGGDFIPAFDSMRWPGDEYRDAVYVRAQVEQLAQQIKSLT